MILIDANILLYAHDSSSLHHTPALEWWKQALVRESSVGLPWVSVSAFLRISTHPRAVKVPLTQGQAISIVNSWFATGAVKTISPGTQFWQILSTLLTAAQVTGPLITDAFIAALAIENSATVVTNDRDFLRFPEVKTLFPLA